MVQKRFGNTVCIVMPSDHFIEDEDICIDTLNNAVEYANETEGLFTVGICPSRAATCYGYIKYPEKSIGSDTVFYKAEAFKGIDALLKKFSSLNKMQKDIIAFTVIAFFAVLTLRGAFYGIASPDESFYLTIPYRIIQGDALLVDEWHASQFSSFLLYLPMKLFILISGKTDGIILFFRCLFVLSQTAVCVYVYFKLKKYGIFTALVTSVIFLLYVPENVNMIYFCFDEPPAAFTTWYISGELYLYDEYYTEEEHRPSVIYVPKNSFFWNNASSSTYISHTQFFKNMFSCDVENGTTGKILYVKKMR